MKRKFFQFLSLLMLMLYSTSAWADVAVLTSPSASTSEHSDADGIVTLVDDATKGGIQTGSGSFTYGGKSYTPMKLSGSRQFSLSYSSDVTINSVTLIGTDNKADGNEYHLGVSGSDRTSIGTFAAKGATPSEFDITGKAGLNADVQFLAIIVVDYTKGAATEPTINVSAKTLNLSLASYNASKSEKLTLSGEMLTNGTYNVTTSAAGLSVSPTSFTVVDGAVNQEFTVAYAAENAVETATETIVFKSADADNVEASTVVTYGKVAQRGITELSSISDSYTWDFSKTGATTVQLTSETSPAKEDQFVLANLAEINNDDNFKSDALLVQTEYAVREGKYMQGGYVKFNTTVAGTIKVAFSNTGDRKGDETLTRYLHVNGVKTEFGANNANAVTTDEIAVEAGDVVLTSKMSSSEADQYIRVYSIAFTAASQGGDEPGDEPGGEDIDPSTAKLLWDYTEAAPTGSPDNGLTYASTVNDAAGTNNGLKGIKMNSSGYAYFTKAAVAGTLKLTFGPRSGSNASSLGIYTYTSTPSAEKKIGVTKEVTELSTDAIELTAEQNNIYIMREAAVEQVLTKIEFVPFVPRTFQDFELDFVNVTALPETPAGVTSMEGKPRGDAHGLDNFKMVVPVDGAVKVTIGGCQYSNTEAKILNSKNETIASIDVKTPGCYHNGGVATYIYSGEADVLTIMGAQYTPYIKIEAIEVAPCTVTFKDQDGNVIKTIDTFEGEALGEIPSSDGINVPEGSKFRGWFYSSGVKAKATDLINGNTTITAKVTPIETVEVGSVQTYNLTSNIFYPEDHETIDIEGGYFHDAQHGWAVATGAKVSVDVAGNAQVILSLCKYSKDAPITVTDASGNEVTTIASAYNENDGALATVLYKGDATTLTFTFAQGESYLHKITVYNVQEFLEKDENTGWYIVPAGDAAALLLALNSANAETGATIFLPNGTYDLGNTVLTTISGKNMSIIGESMEGTIIKTKALEEKLGVADLFYNTSIGLYMQDLTLQNDFDYYNSGAAGRAAVLQDNGNQTILRNVAMRSYQDTYYSKSGNYYFEGGLIQGTVDYICGGGNAWFENITLLNKSRSATAKSGDDTMTAYQGTGKYIFNNCSVESECKTFNFGRSWGDAYVVYLNTTIKSGLLIDTRFSTADMNSKPRFFGEYNTIDESGNGKNTPASNVLTTTKGANFESVLTAEQAATYTLGSLFSTWNPKAIAEQAEADATDIASDVLYLVESEGKFEAIVKGSALNLAELVGKTIRKANSRGGFGEPTVVEKTDAINLKEYASAQQKTAKVYDITGREVNAPAKGVYIIDGKKYIK